MRRASQTFADVAGATYTVACFFAYGGSSDPNAFLTVSAGGQSVTETSLVALPYPPNPATFTFTGTGSDTLTISAATNPAEWYVDDVSVTGSAVGGVPEPSTWAMMLLGFLGLSFAFRQSRRKVKLA